MSTLYVVRVREIEDDTTAVLDVRVVHPDSMYISATPGFALMLLWEGAESGDPITAEVDLETLLDADWMRKYAPGIVRGAEIIALENEPPAAADSDYEHAYWQNPEEWLRGTMRVQVSDPAWIAHLSEGQSWDSTAFESNSSFESCEPISFEPQAATPAVSDDPRAGLMPVPRVFFLDYLGAFDDEFIWFPKYSDKAYVATEVYEGVDITDDVLDALVGEVVWYENYGDGVGVLAPDRMAIHISKGSRGGRGVSAGQGKIGPARFDTSKKRLADPLTIADLARTADPAVVDAEVDGATVSLTVHSFATGRELNLGHEAEALALIAAPECESFDAFANATSPLGTLLNAKANEEDIGYEGQIYPKFAKGIVVDWKVEKIKDAEPVDFDALSDDELMAKLREQPWDTWSIDITVTDPALVAHLPSMTPFGHGFNWVEEPQPWDEAPLTAGG